MVKIKTLFMNKWVEIRKMVYENGSEWIYSHNPWCNSVGVAILPFKVYKDDNKRTKVIYLGVAELCPAHHESEKELATIKGGYDNSDKFSLEQCAINELEEEGGFTVKPSELIYLGTSKPNKSSDTVMHLYAVDISNAKEVKATSDGTSFEENLVPMWVTHEELVFSKDPLAACMLSRLSYIASDPDSL